MILGQEPIKNMELNEILDSKRDFGIYEKLGGGQIWYPLDCIIALALEIRDLKDEIEKLKKRAMK